MAIHKQRSTAKFRGKGTTILIVLVTYLNGNAAMASPGASNASQQVQETLWQAYVDGDSSGPYRESQMISFIREGRLTASAPVRPASGGGWVRADDAFAKWFQEGPELQSPAPVTASTVSSPDFRTNLVFSHSQVTSAKHLAVTSVVLWCSGMLMQFIGAGITVSGALDGDGNIYAGLSLFFTGSALTFIAPVMATVAEKRMKNAINQLDHKGLRAGNRRLPIGAYTGIGFGLLAAGIGGMFIQAIDIGLMAIYASEVFTGLACFGALRRIRRFERRYMTGLRIFPQVGKGSIGAGLVATF